MSWPRTGTTVLDRYVLSAQIGRGGMSEVYHAIDTVGNRAAAVKLLSPTFASDARARSLAHREAWVIQQVRHPTVPALYDHGETLLAEGVAVPCTVMELLTGVMLTDRLTRGPFPWPEAVRTVATIADAVAVAHRRGIVHRDLTPQNLMITDSGIKIIDFGLAGTCSGQTVATVKRLSGRLGRRGRLLARRGSRAGAARIETPPSAAPNGTPATRCDPADDVYSLGVLLYHLLTGRSPYPAASQAEQLAAARLRHAAPTPIVNVTGMPRTVGDVCRSCMAKRPQDRPDSAEVSLSLWSILPIGQQ